MSWPFRHRPVLPPRGAPLPELTAAPKFNAAVLKAHSTIQAPWEMAVLVGLAAMSTAIQGGHDVVAPYGKSLPTSLWVAGFGESGERKDGLTNYFYRGLGQLRKLLHFQYKEERKKWQAKHMVWKKKVRSVEKSIEAKISAGESCSQEEEAILELIKNEPVEPIDYLLTLEDGTPAAIAEQLQKASGCIAIISPEGASVIDGRTFDNLALLNTAWSGSSITIARKHSGVIEIADPRVVMMMLIQPSVMSEYMRKKGAKSRGIGTWARFLVCYPQSTQGYRPPSVADSSLEEVDEFSTRIQELAKRSLVIARDPHGSRLEVTFSKEAEFRCYEVVGAIEIDLRSGGRFENARDHASKLAENIIRVAAVIHVFEGFDGGVSLDTLELAIGICFHCSDQFLDLFCGPPQDEVDLNIMRSWIGWRVSKGNRYRSRAYINRFGPGGLRNSVRMYRALDGLVALGVIREFGLGNVRCIDFNPGLPFDEGRAKYEIENPVSFFDGL